MISEVGHHRGRLALLLAGGGSACRRQVAALAAGEDPLEGLRRRPRLEPLVRSATDLLGAAVDTALARAADLGWRFSVPADEDYPRLLTTISDPPLGLFVRGRIPPGPAAAVVGSRRATAYGREVARILAEEMAGSGVTLVSGMARGIDGIGHRAVLDHGGRTVAVWGTGPDEVYPREHASLAEDIAAGGALLTEYPPGTPPRRHHFPERNRLIAGLAPVVVVVEAAARSGALVTARQALDEGREVLAVPGSILAPLSVGPNALIRMGARPLLTPRDLHEALGSPPPPATTVPDHEPDHPLLAAMVSGRATSADDLAAGLGRAVSEVVAELLALELDGRVERTTDGRYRRS